MSARLTVIICTYNPHQGRLARTLAGLRAQSLQVEEWELLLIDNRSNHPLDAELIKWHPHGRLIREEELGLTPARLRGIREASTDCLVWVDDDNILDEGFLLEAKRVFHEHPKVGAFGGPAKPEFEVEPPEWFTERGGPLGIGEYGNEERVTRWEPGGPRAYPPASPHGAGMCLRRAVAVEWAKGVKQDAVRRRLGRRGANLSSGEDNDIVLTTLGLGHSIGYFPRLALTHLIPASRLTLEYHRRLVRASNRTWVVVLHLHKLNGWSPIHIWTLPFRKARAFLRLQPWRGPVAQLSWDAACGQFEGRADIAGGGR